MKRRKALTFTYSEANINTALAKVRTLVGDVDSTNPLLSDEVINFFISEASDNIYTAAYLSANAIQAKFARFADTTIESVSVNYSQKALQYAALARDLKAHAEMNDISSPSVLGVSIDGMSAQEENEDRVKDKFTMDRFSNPQNGDDA